MNLSDIKKQLSANLGGETATDLHSTEDRLRAINQAYKDITLEQEIGQGTLPVTLPVAQSTLAIPGQSIMIGHDGITTLTGKLIQVGYEELSMMRNTGTPPHTTAYWAIDSARNGTVIEFWPAPRVSTLLRINYLSAATPMTLDTDQPWGGRYEQHHDLIPMLAASRLFREKGSGQEDMQASRFWLSEYEREAEKLTRVRRREHGGRTALVLHSGGKVSKRRGWRDE